jgi:hypothetical protein
VLLFNGLLWFAIIPFASFSAAFTVDLLCASNVATITLRLRSRGLGLHEEGQK